MSNIKKILEHYGAHFNGDKCCCPLHGEKTASFQIYEDTESWYCFGSCGKGGDAVEFVKEIEGIGFKEAMEKVCELTGTTKEEYMEKSKEPVVKENVSDNQAMDIEDVKSLIRSVGYKANGYRGIRDDINQFYGHLTKLDTNGSVIARYYPETNGNSKVTGYKCRNHPKDFSHGKIGSTGAKSQLSGQVKFKSPSKYVLYVGGEEDKAAAYQMLLDNRSNQDYDSIPVVSPTSGEGSAAKQAAMQYDWFDQYDIIIIGMDQDDAGRKAAKEIAAVLPKEKIRIATWSGKDPNQMLLDGKEKQFVRDFYNAKEFINSGISSSGDAEAGLAEFLTAPKIGLPPQLSKLQTAMRGGIKSTGSVVNIIGDTSIGKSFLSDTLIYHWLFHSPRVPTIVSLERTKEELTIDLLSMHLKKNLMWFTDGHDAVDYLNQPEVQLLKNELLYNEVGEPRFFIIDEREGDIELLKRQMEKSGKVNDSRLMVIDPLTDFLRSLGTEIQENFMMWQKLQKKNGFVFINILHTRKPPTDKDGNVRKVTEYDALGSGTFIQSADINIVINRDKMTSDAIERNTTYVDMPKCRGGITGEICALYYDAETRQQYDRDEYFNRDVEEPPLHHADEPDF
ncbi:CHC2 zinc finger domain-containing protein [Sulfurovum sp.]|uniref:CHC2 zinc finger domain-containing protein n=1 Tax=Sulfurovum sp. TaxID=1969726 RepID=UPI0035696D01